MRHGNTFEEGQTPIQIGLRTDLPLTPFGKRQAGQMAEYVRQKWGTVSAIFAGRLKRQMETASAIADLLAMAVERAAVLNEIDYGLWEGLTTEQIAHGWPLQYTRWSANAEWQSAIFQGQAQEHVQNLQNWFAELHHKFPASTLLAVTSGGILRLIHNEKVKTGHFCEIDLGRDSTSIVSWNQSPKSVVETEINFR